MDAPVWLEAHRAAERIGVTTNLLAGWARRGWIEQRRRGSRTFYSADEIDRFIDGGYCTRPSNVSPFSDALARARVGFGIGPAASTASRPKKRRQSAH